MNIEPEPEPGGKASFSSSAKPQNLASILPKENLSSLINCKSNNNDLPLSYLKNVTISIEQDLIECKKLWDEFSPKLSLFDTWDFRFAFYKGYQFKPYFIQMLVDQEPVALLPLCFDDEQDKYFWFGSDWHEDNQFFVKNNNLLPLLISIIPNSTSLNAINISQESLFKYPFIADEPKFVLNLDKINTLNDFLLSLKKKKRYNLKRDYERIKSLKPEIIINNFNDLDVLIKLNRKRFESRGIDTSWQDERKVTTFKEILKLPHSNPKIEIRMITVKIGDSIAGVDLMAIYNKRYYCLKGGNDIDKFPGIGNFLSQFEIEDALSLNMEKMDFLSGDFGYKNSLFTRVDQYKLIK